MDDSKAMPQPPSPHPSPAADHPGDLGSLPPSRDDFGAPVPLYTPTPPPSSPRPSVPASTMTTSVQDIAPSTLKELPASSFEDLADSDTMQWGPHSTLPLNSMAPDDAAFHLPMQFGAGTAAPYSYDRSAFNDNYNLSYQSALHSSCPRSLSNGFGFTALPSTGINMSSYPPNMYQLHPQQPYEGLDLSQSPNNNLLQLDEYDYNLQHVSEDATAYSSPYESDVSRSSTPNAGSPSTLDDEPIDKDLPYAQLIYRALLQAPNKTMILRDIYDWFRQNTDKAADKDTKGWQNSIRHNLSMNGAFEKVDQPCEEARKGFMWRLTDDAIEHGVKSTTRYRSKQPNKRGHRSGLYPQKQRAGAIGGRNAKKQLRQRRLHEVYRSEPYQSSRSVPTPATFDAGFHPDMSMYSRSAMSPYYSPPGSECDHHELPTDSFSDILEARRSNMMQHHGFHGPPMVSSPLTSGYIDAHIQMPDNPTESLFTDTPSSPSASEPRTPPDSDGPGWNPMTFGPLSDISHFGYGPDFVSSVPHESFDGAE